MFRLDCGRTDRYCDGVSRRSFLQLGVAGMGAAGLSDVLRTRAMASPGTSAKDTSVILIWLDGGPSHLDLYDLKPTAPAEYRGIWNPIRTNVPGIDISELFPRQAQHADKFSIVRSLHHKNGDHFTAAHLTLTGRGGPNGLNTAPKSPFFGAAAVAQVGSRRNGMPAHAAVPLAMTVGLRPGYMGAGYAGQKNNPFETEGDPNAQGFQVNNVNLAGGLTVARLDDRVHLSQQFDRLRRAVEARGQAAAMDQYDRQAYELVTGTAGRQAFDISQESDEIRNRYGRHTWAQSTLLARRLVEAGTTFVTVHLGGWDHHWDLKKGMETNLPIVDQMVAALFQDLAERGLLDKTLVMLCGEFSRTPRMNDGGNGGAPGSMGTPGRDHWGDAMFCLMGGGGVKGGRIVGATNSRGEFPVERPVTPADIHHTVFHVLGADPNQQLLDHSGRPVTAVEPGAVISELL